MAQPIVVRVASSRSFWLVILLVLAAQFRITAVQTTVVEGPLRADALDYYLSAYNLVHHGTYSRSRAAVANPPGKPEPDAFRSPGVALMIAPFMSMWPDHPAIVARVQWVNIVLGTLAVAAIFLAAAAVLPLAAAIVAGLLCALAPHLVSLTVYVLSETPGSFVVSVLLALCALGVPTRRVPRVAYFMALGVTVGCLALFRPAFIAFAPLMALSFRHRRDMLHALLLGCIGAALVMGPWVIRNAVSVRPGSGPSLLATVTLEGSYRGYVFNNDPATFPYGAHRDPRFEQLTMSLPAVLQEVSQKFMADPVGSLIWYVLQKPVFLFQWNGIDGVGGVLVYPVSASPFLSNELFVGIQALYRSAHWLFLLLTALGAAIAWWPPMSGFVAQSKLHVVRMASLLLVFLYFVHLPFIVHARYALPVYPAMYLLATFGAVAALRRIWIPTRVAAGTANPKPAVALAAKPATTPRRPRSRKGGARHR